MPAIKQILLVDDHAVVRNGLALMLQKIPGLQVVGEAETGWQGVKLARHLQPHVVILDLKLPDISGLEVTQRLLASNPDLKILILTAATHAAMSNWLQAAGAHGFLTKAATLPELQQAIAALFTAKTVLNQDDSASAFKQLTVKEIEIMLMMIRGHTIRHIAQQLFLEPKTIYTYRCEIFKKMNVKNVVALAQLALQQGILEIGEIDLTRFLYV